jgi:hypothetical protein
VRDATGDRPDGRTVDATKETKSNMPADIPLLPNIHAEAPSPNLIKYRIALGARDAAQFYQVEMPKNQWVAFEEHLIRADLAVLSFAKADKRATIIIHQDGGTDTRIMITVNDPAAN